MISRSLLKSKALPSVRRILKPGQKGTVGLVNQYGDQLICVRYRYDPIRKRRLKTVEFIVEEKYWKPDIYKNLVPNCRVGIRIGYSETEIRQNVKDAGGKWNAVHKVWELPLDTVFEMDLEDRIVYKEDLSKHLSSI